MLFGEYNQQTDEKGRIRIPAKMKPFLGEDVMISRGTGGCLFLFPASEWKETIGSKIKGIPMSDLAIQKSLRLLMSWTDSLETDNQGRSLLPKTLRDVAKIKKDIVVIGVGNRAEIWSKEVYEDYLEGKVDENSTNYDILFAELIKYGV